METGKDIKAYRVRKISQNFFLHIHFPRIRPEVLQPSATFGFGLILASLFIILLVTGIFLMLYYTPSVERAYYSVKEIMFIVPGGRLLRNMHRWASHGMVLVVFLHLGRVFYASAYYGKRRSNWIIGVVLLMLTIGMSFSGYLLPWDQLAYWAVTIGANISAAAREITDALAITHLFDPGGLLKRILVGGENVGQAALTRFYTWHVVWLPVSMIILFGYHFWRIRKAGGLQIHTINSKPKREEEDELFSWPALMWAELAVFLAMVAAIMVIAFFIDAPLKTIANPSVPENPAKSPWYLLGIQELVAYSAFIGGWIIPFLFLFFLFSVPSVDREELKEESGWFSGSTGKKVLGWSLLLSGIATTVLIVGYAWLNSRTGWMGSQPYLLKIILNPGTLSLLVYVAWSLIVNKIYYSRRMASIALFTCALTGLLIFTIVGIWIRGENWSFAGLF